MFAASKTKGVSAVAANYIEDVFSTWLYTGNGSTQTITNGIDLAGKGGMVFFGERTYGANHVIVDSERNSFGNVLYSNLTNAQSNWSPLVVPQSNGFQLSTYSPNVPTNQGGGNYASWTFRKQPKFFDVVTYTGDGNYSTDPARAVSHSLGSKPGFVIIKRTSGAGEWFIAARKSTGGWVGSQDGTSTGVFALNRTNAGSNYNDAQVYADATSFYPAWIGAGGTSGTTNDSGATYIAYLFAHNAGGFGLTGTDNVISCGSFSGNTTVNLGYEPQFVLMKSYDVADAWYILDNMRGWTNNGSNGNDAYLRPNSSGAETTGSSMGYPTATGFTTYGFGGANAIYIAIRRGPMKVPTDGTKVFAPLARTGTGTNPTVVTSGTNPDLLMSFPRTASPAAYGMVFFDKLRGVSQFLQSANTNAEATTAGTYCLQGFLNTGFQTGADFIEGYLNFSGSTYAQYPITRAPGFFDEVCYTGNSTAGRAINHNLGVAPELMIVKNRTTATTNWTVGLTSIGVNNNVFLNYNGAAVNYGATFFYNTNPTSSVFYVGNDLSVNSGSTQNYVAYLFASCPGVSKVGSYTGNGTTQTINCGFTGGARFVLIKRTDSTGDWYVYDTARGMTVLTDPYLLLNSTAAESATLGSVITTSVGFIVDATILAAVNTNGASYIFLAIA